MSQQNDTQESTNDATAAGQDDQPVTPEVPMNRAERRALAMGKKSGGNKPVVPHQSMMRGQGHPGAPQAPPARMQTRGSNRGK